MTNESHRCPHTNKPLSKPFDQMTIGEWLKEACDEPMEVLEPMTHYKAFLVTLVDIDNAAREQDYKDPIIKDLQWAIAWAVQVLMVKPEDREEQCRVMPPPPSAFRIVEN